MKLPLSVCFLAATAVEASGPPGTPAPSLLSSFYPSINGCKDEPDWKASPNGMGCDIINKFNNDNPQYTFCVLSTDGNHGGKSVYESCCSCGGGGDHVPIAPSSTLSLSSSPSNSNGPTQAPSHHCGKSLQSSRKNRNL